jgi:hypothetical protein
MFILECIFLDDYNYASIFDTSHAMFEGLHTCHKKLGLHAQINLLFKAFDIYYKLEGGTPMTTTSKILCNLHERIKRMGLINADKIFLWLIINSLRRHHPQLQSLIHGMTNNPNFTENLALKHIDTEAALAQRHAELGVSFSSVALVTSNANAKNPPVVCSNCKKPHHTIDFCIKPEGKMASCSIDEAKATQCAAAGKASWAPRTGGQTANMAQAMDLATTSATASNTSSTGTTQSPNVTLLSIATMPVTTVPATLPSSVLINRVSYVLTPSPAHTILPPQSANLCDHTGVPLMVDNLLDFRAFIAVHNTP